MQEKRIKQRKWRSMIEKRESNYLFRCWFGSEETDTERQKGKIEQRKKKTRMGSNEAKEKKTIRDKTTLIRR